MREHDPGIEEYVRAVLDRIPRAAPFRERVGDDVRLHLSERVEAGESLAEAVRRMGPPEEVARAYLAEVELETASVGRRLGAFAIDLAVGAAVVTPALLATVGAFFSYDFLVSGRWAPGPEAVWFALAMTIAVIGVSVFVLSVLYFPVLEAVFGQTLGKRLVGVYVASESGERIGWGAAILRRLPFFLEFFWLDALFALFTRRRQRAFDLVARTLVVRG